MCGQVRFQGKLKSHQAPNHCLFPPLKPSHCELGDVLLRPMLVLQPELVLPAVHGVRLEDVQGGDVAVGEVARLGRRSSVLAVGEPCC